MAMVVSHEDPHYQYLVPMSSLPIFRVVGSDSLDQTYAMSMETKRRQVFLRSYQFSRKKTLTEKIRSSLLRIKRLIVSRLRCARKLRKIVWSRLLCYRSTRSRLRRRSRYSYYSRLRFLRSNNGGSGSGTFMRSNSSSSCFW